MWIAVFSMAGNRFSSIICCGIKISLYVGLVVQVTTNLLLRTDPLPYLNKTPGILLTPWHSLWFAQYICRTVNTLDLRETLVLFMLCISNTSFKRLVFGNGRDMRVWDGMAAFLKQKKRVNTFSDDNLLKFGIECPAQSSVLLLPPETCS